MIEYKRISTPSASAIFLALAEGRTLKPITMASEAVASNTSDSDMAPTPLCIIRIAISSVESFSNESAKASTDPSTSPFNIKFNSLKLPRAKRRPISSSVMCFLVLIPVSRSICARLVASSLASDSLSNTLNFSPACGAPLKPNTCTGPDGPTLFTFEPL